MCSGSAGQLWWSRKPTTPRGASPKWVGAPGAAHEDERRVRWLGTDEAAGTEARRGLPKGDSGGGAGKMNGKVLFYRGEHRDRQDGSALAAST
jgi:hypothetical protein